MAKEGTKVPDDAGKPNLIPSVARPDQRGEDTAGGLGSSTLHQVDNATARTGYVETVSAAGGELPDDIGHNYSRSGGKEREGKHGAPHGGRNQPSHG